MKGIYHDPDCHDDEYWTGKGGEPRVVAADEGDLWGVGDDGDQVPDNNDHDCHDDEDEHNIIVNINLHFPTQSPKPKLILQ